MRIGRMRVRTFRRYLVPSASEAQTLIDGLDALNRENKDIDYTEMREVLVEYAYGSPGVVEKSQSERVGISSEANPK